MRRTHVWQQIDTETHLLIRIRLLNIRPTTYNAYNNVYSDRVHVIINNVPLSSSDFLGFFLKAKAGCILLNWSGVKCLAHSLEISITAKQSLRRFPTQIFLNFESFTKKIHRYSPLTCNIAVVSHTVNHFDVYRLVSTDSSMKGNKSSYVLCFCMRPTFDVL